MCIFCNAKQPVRLRQIIEKQAFQCREINEAISAIWLPRFLVSFAHPMQFNMKRLFIIRHAKSSWEDILLLDFDRPLNKRGIRDAPFMGKVLAGKEEKIDQLVSSPANRAMTTSKYFAESLDFDPDKIIYNKDIYEAHSNTLMDIICLLYTSPSPRDRQKSRMPSSA